MKHSYISILTVIIIHFHIFASDYVALTEIMYDVPYNAVNGGNANCYGEFIELYNAHEQAVNLAGWSLVAQHTSADPSQTFTFSQCTIPPRSFLLVAYGSRYSHNDPDEDNFFDSTLLTKTPPMSSSKQPFNCQTTPAPSFSVMLRV